MLVIAPDWRLAYPLSDLLQPQARPSFTNAQYDQLALQPLKSQDTSGEARAGGEPLDPQTMADMALIIGHRIRGLVTTIEGFTDLLADTLIDREQRELALRIFEGAARIESILADLQMFAQPVAPVRSSVRTSTLIDDLAAAVSDELIDRVDFVPGSNASVSVDRMLIRQALLVLVQNAAEATASDDMIRVAIEESVGCAFVHVSHPGLMNENVARDAFRPFYTTKAHNLGVGLPIARRIAQAHGGGVDLTANDSDAGIRFTMQLPLADGGDVVA